MALGRLQLKERLLRDPTALRAQIIDCFRRLDPERIILFGSVVSRRVPCLVVFGMPNDLR